MIDQKKKNFTIKMLWSKQCYFMVQRLYVKQKGKKYVLKKSCLILRRNRGPNERIESLAQPQKRYKEGSWYEK